jgi:MoaA/NifB/PqqE/SkfB family radical SAM enzyme
VFEEWMRHDIGEVYVQMFDTTLANWVGEQPRMCVHCETRSLALALEHNGDVYSCDHFVEPRHLLGNISERHLIDLLSLDSNSGPVSTSATRSRATAPSELTQVYRTRDGRRGRNEPCTCGSGRKWKQCHGR